MKNARMRQMIKISPEPIFIHPLKYLFLLTLGDIASYWYYCSLVPERCQGINAVNVQLISTVFQQTYSTGVTPYRRIPRSLAIKYAAMVSKTTTCVHIGYPYNAAPITTATSARSRVSCTLFILLSLHPRRHPEYQQVQPDCPLILLSVHSVNGSSLPVLAGPEFSTLLSVLFPSGLLSESGFPRSTSATSGWSMFSIMC